MQSIAMIHTGTERFVRPSLGSWTLYGLGTEAEDLPGLRDARPDHAQRRRPNCMAPPSCLPCFKGPRLTGVRGRHAEHLERTSRRRRTASPLDYVRQAQQQAVARRIAPANAELEGLIESYELAFKMQTSVPETFSFDDESNETLDL